MSNPAPITLQQLFRFYKQLPHQTAAIAELENDLKQHGYDVAMRRDRDWFKTWSQDGKQSDEQNSWLGIKAIAARVGAKYPELVSAQWACESGWGKHTSAENNYFGLKGAGEKHVTQEFVNGKWITITDSFIEFPDLESCIVYLVDHWYKDFGKYKGVNRASNREEAAELLIKEGYATDPNYAAKLIALMNQQEPQVKPSLADGKMLEKVRYFSQRDSQVAGQANRMCFSSSCAMLAAYLRPNELRGVNADDFYLSKVFQFGDTTDANAQIKALMFYGIKAKFVQNADFATIQKQIDRGIPVPCGFLHHGTSNKPSGSGHWLCVIGYTEGAVIVHDPFGEYDVVSGQYLSSKGARQTYSKKNWGLRWMVEGNGSGWAIIAE